MRESALVQHDLSQAGTSDSNLPEVSEAACAASPTDVSQHIAAHAAQRPGQTAIVVLGRNGFRAGNARRATSKVTFSELEERVQRLASGLLAAGFQPGMRVLLMVRPGVEFVVLTFAMFRAGVVPVMIDPGMGVSRMLECIRQVDLHGFIGIPLAQVIRLLRPAAFRSVEHVVTVGRSWAWGGRTLAEIERLGHKPPGMSSQSEPRPLGSGCGRGVGESGASATLGRDPKRQDTLRPREGTRESSGIGAVLFTSGSTGPAKGVVYEHDMLNAQVRMIQSQYGIEPGEIDVPTFPLFALFSVAMGMTVVIPQMDASRPGRANPAKIVEAISGFQATNTFGSPALWRRVGYYCVSREIKLPSLRRILIAGAPVPWPTIEQLHSVLGPDADVHTPYGATESLPVSTISGREIIGVDPTSSFGPNPSSMQTGGPTLPKRRISSGEHWATRDYTRRGLGTCVGRPVAGTNVRIIRISDEPVETWSSDLSLPPGEIGEIGVSGPVVTQEYFGLPAATRSAKIRDGDTVWHRIGDVGYFDEKGRLWFCGRKNHRVVTETGTLFTECCEAIFHEHPEVSRCALVGVGPRGRQTPVIIVECRDARLPRGKRAGRFRGELATLARSNQRTTAIDRFLFRRSLPVDVRHNAKINRELLAAWAAERIANGE